MKQNKVRYSVGLFTLIKEIVHVPEELVDDDHPLRYKPFDHFEFLRFYVSEEAKNFENRIRAFSGI